MGLALHNYQEALTYFPPAHIGRWPCAAAGQPVLNATGLTMLLPYLDQTALWNSYNSKGAAGTYNPSAAGTVMGDPTANGNLAVIRTAVSMFACPSDNGIPIMPSGGGSYGASATNTGAGGYKTNYDFSTYGSAYISACEDWGSQAATARRLFGDNSSSSLRDITDGSSNSIALCETTRMVANGGNNAWGYRGWVMVGIDLAAYSINNWTYGANTYPAGQLGSWAYPGSLHTGGAHFLFADGAVRFINQNIDTITRQRLALISDGNTIGEY
jgi:prepilin-type processing-associated H-X9-DG protein